MNKKLETIKFLLYAGIAGSNTGIWAVIGLLIDDAFIWIVTACITLLSLLLFVFACRDYDRFCRHYPIN
jgi:hypothetical protein